MDWAQNKVKLQRAQAECGIGATEAEVKEKYLAPPSQQHRPTRDYWFYYQLGGRLQFVEDERVVEVKSESKRVEKKKKK